MRITKSAVRIRDAILSAWRAQPAVSKEAAVHRSSQDQRVPPPPPQLLWKNISTLQTVHPDCAVPIFHFFACQAWMSLQAASGCQNLRLKF